uniref:Reverse transcriptase domain-containing protein n=1 Tax=Seriola dumerili TaxID=41447 RepID=A0A3B4TRJ9_SERDU
MIKVIGFKDNNITYHLKEINQAFYEFYNKLYKSYSNYSQEELINKLLESDQQYLNSPFTEVVLATVKSIRSNKSPGPDGFSDRFYQEFWNDLQPIFISMIKSFCHNRILPQSMYVAHINVPINLIIVMFFILASVIATSIDYN